MFLLGPKASGKSSIGNQLSVRTNMNLINFDEFISNGGYEGYDDEKITSEFISYLAKILSPRVAIKNFP
jgi:shikimate kinase